MMAKRQFEVLAVSWDCCLDLVHDLIASQLLELLMKGRVLVGGVEGWQLLQLVAEGVELTDLDLQVTVMNACCGVVTKRAR